MYTDGLKVRDTIFFKFKKSPPLVLHVLEDEGSVILRGFGNCLYQLTQLDIPEDLYLRRHR
jgi:hypothetical protein